MSGAPPRSREPEDGRPANDVDPVDVSPHGAVAVFRAPRRARDGEPATAPARTPDWDEIHSPFLDLVTTADPAPTETESTTGPSRVDSASASATASPAAASPAASAAAPAGADLASPAAGRARSNGGPEARRSTSGRARSADESEAAGGSQRGDEKASGAAVAGPATGAEIVAARPHSAAAPAVTPVVDPVAQSRRRAGSRPASTGDAVTHDPASPSAPIPVAGSDDDDDFEYGGVRFDETGRDELPASPPHPALPPAPTSAGPPGERGSRPSSPRERDRTGRGAAGAPQRRGGQIGDGRKGRRDDRRLPSRSPAQAVSRPVRQALPSAEPGAGADALTKPAATRPNRPAGNQRSARIVEPQKVTRGRGRDRDPAVELAISEIAGHLTFTANTVTAWYWLPEVRWSFRPDAEREAVILSIAEQYSSLAGFRLHLRRTTRPFAADDWARTVDQLTPSPLPSPPGAPSWADHLVAAQRHLHAVNHAEGQTYLGVTFARRSLGSTMSERLATIFGRGVPEAERRRMARNVEQFDEVLGSFGMRGRRATVEELEWLLYRSVALGMAPPTLSSVAHGHWETGDLLAITESIERYRTPYGSTVKLVNRLTGEERHVAVLTVGRMEPLEIPERHEPWLHFHERMPWPMELSSRVDILGPGDSFRNLEHRLRMIRSQQLDYAEHGMDAPQELERLAKRALYIGDEMTTGLPVDSSRAHGWHRIAVSGPTREECLERARRLTAAYSRELRIALQHPKNQEWLAREFIPGEPVANTGYMRRMPTKLLAAALPQAASNVGDRRGDLIGRTAGTSRRPVFLDLHYPMEVRERSGLAVFVAEPGGGKSTLLGALGYLAARRGVQVTLLDPSGPLARLAAMPELAPYSRVLNLTGSDQGTLAPYALIPTPQRTHFAAGGTGDREYEIALSNARAERRMLVQDICAMLVPPQVAREASTATLLRHAVRTVPAEESSTLDDIVAFLRGMGDDNGTELANLLMDTAEMPLAMLFFGTPPPGLLGSDAALTVITMAGLRLPDLKIEREYWSAEEALALPMLHTAHRLAVRRCYGGSMHARKLVGLDEGHFMEGWRSGRSFLVRLARDSRKWNLAALVASQNPQDILGLDVQNLVSTVFVGRIAQDAQIAAEALRLLRVPTDVGYEETLASLSASDPSSSTRLGFREFIMRDVDGRVQRMRVDVTYLPSLLEYLDTTPTAAPAPGRSDMPED